jgi:hypothetical protein
MSASTRLGTGSKSGRGVSPAMTRKMASPALPRKAKTKAASGRLKTATVSVRAPAPRPTDSPSKSKPDKNKVTKHEDRKVAKRNAALNAMGGMKVCPPLF